MSTLHVIDYMIFAVSIVSSFSIGIYYACAKDTNKTTDDYLVGGRRMNIVPVSISYMVSFFSAISMMGNSSEMYYYGTEMWLGIFGWFIGIILTAFVVIPLLHPLKLTSIHHYLYLRYNSKALMYAGTAIQSIAFCFINGVVLFGPAIMLKSFSGVPIWISIIGAGLVSTIYTSIGGFKAVIWSDVFQAVIIFVGMITINVLGTINVGGIKEVWNIMVEHGRAVPNYSFSPIVRSTVPGYVIGFAVTGFVFFSVLQVSVQRFCALPSVKMAQMSLCMSAIPYMLVVSLTCTSGMVTFAYFAHLGCDPLASGEITNPNQILVYFIQTVLNYPSIPGLFIASIFCGSLSNLSSFFNGVAAMIWDDIIKDSIETYKMTDVKKTIITKIIAFTVGIMSTMCGLIVSQMGGTLLQMAVVIGSSSVAPIAIVIFLGALSPIVSAKSSSIGAICGISLILWLNIGSSLHGVNKKTLPLVTTNCSQYSPAWNSTDVQNRTSEIDDLYKSPYLKDREDFYRMVTQKSNGLEISTEENKYVDYNQEEKDEEDVFIMYRISYVWFTPLGLILGMTVGMLLSFIPGLRNTEEVNPQYLFPFVRFLMRKTGYLKYETKDNEMYVLDQNENVSHI